jgi:hypothetical protein
VRPVRAWRSTLPSSSGAKGTQGGEQTDVGHDARWRGMVLVKGVWEEIRNVCWLAHFLHLILPPTYIKATLHSSITPSITRDERSRASRPPRGCRRRT